MLLPEDRLEVLLDQLNRLRARDRRAILSRFSPRERALIAGQRRKLGKVAPASAAADAQSAAAEYSPDIAERIAALHAGSDVKMTKAGKDALARLLAPTATSDVPARPAKPTASLADTLGGLLRQRRVP